MQDERQQDALRLGRVQRPLQRRLGGLLVAELLAGGRVEHLRLDRRRAPGAAPARCRSSTGPRTSSARSGVAIGQRDDGGGDAHVGAVALVLARRPRAARAPRLAGRGAPARCSRRARAATPNACSPASSASMRSAASSAASASSGRPCASAQQAARVVDDQLAAGLTARVQRALRALQPLLGLVQAPEPQQVQRPRREAGDEHRVLAPAVRLRDRHRLLGEREPGRAGLPGPRPGDREVAERAHLQPRAARRGGPARAPARGGRGRRRGARTTARRPRGSAARPL